VDDDLRPTPLTPLHEAAGARLAGFAGWAMPIRFAGTLAEHEAVRSDVGVFDVSHLGTVLVEGPGALAVVAATFTNDPSGLRDGTSQYTLCCDDDGGIVDDLIVYRLSTERWFAVPNAANTAAVVAALRAAAAASDAPVEVTDASTDWAVLAVQGRNALALVDRVLGDRGATLRTGDVDHLGVAVTEVDGAEVRLCRTGYTGEAGCELVVAAAGASTLWTALVDAGAVPCGLGARDTLRLEMGYPLHGNELSVDTTPFEARLGWAVKLDRPAFRGSDALAAAKQAGPQRRLWGLVAEGKRPLREGARVLVDDAEVGRTTSGSVSPTLGRPIALAYLDIAVEPGATVEVDVRGTLVHAEVVRPPFVDRDPRS
jgi:aminomethyltransferase